MNALETQGIGSRERHALTLASTFLDALAVGDLFLAHQLAPNLVWFGRRLLPKDWNGDAAGLSFAPGALVPGTPHALPDFARAVDLKPVCGVAPLGGDVLVQVDCAFKGRTVTVGLLVGHTVRAVFEPTVLMQHLESAPLHGLTPHP